MDLKYLKKKKKGLIIVLSVILLIAICGCLYFIFRTPKEEPVIENNESVVVEEPIEDNTEDIEEISEEDIKIYNENATRENMIAYLKKETGLEKTVTFGSIEGKYDVVVSEYDQNKVVKTLKKMYEPFLWEPKLKMKEEQKNAIY